MRAWVLLAALAGSPAWAEEWKSLETPDFSVSFPGEVKRSERSDDTQAGSVKTQIWSVDLEHQSFTFAVSEYAPEQLKKSSPATMLEFARDGAMANVGGTLDKDAPTTLDSGEPKKKWPGREFSFHTEKGLQFNSRAFLVSNRLFSLLVVHDGTVKDSADFVRFADSLKLKAQKPAKKAK